MITRSHLVAFGAGMLVGALVTWEGARRWERASWAWSWAAAWLSEAVWLARQAAGWIVVVAVVVVGGGVLVWWAL